MGERNARRGYGEKRRREAFEEGRTGRGIGKREIGQKQLPSADEKPQIRVDTEENK